MGWANQDKEAEVIVKQFSLQLRWLAEVGSGFVEYAIHREWLGMEQALVTIAVH